MKREGWSEDLLTRTRHWASAAARGDPAAFDALYCAWHPAVLRFAYGRIGDWDHAEDITQEAFLRAYRNLRHLRDSAKFPGFVFAIARNLAENLRLRRQRHEAVLLGDVTTEIPHCETPEESLVRREWGERIARAIRSLPKHQREVVWGYYRDNHSTEELADGLGCLAPTVKSRLVRARDSLRRKLGATQEAWNA